MVRKAQLEMLTDSGGTKTLSAAVKESDEWLLRKAERGSAIVTL